MKVKNTGYVLLTTVVMGMVFALLGLTCLQWVLLYTKANRVSVSRQQAFYQLEAETFQLARRQLDRLSESCRIQGVNPELALQANRGCLLSRASGRYRYVVQDLGEQPCVRAGRLGTHHWLLTVQELERNWFLQVRVAKRQLTAACGELHAIQIKPGITSWRYLDKNTAY